MRLELQVGLAMVAMAFGAAMGCGAKVSVDKDGDGGSGGSGGGASQGGAQTTGSPTTTTTTTTTTSITTSPTSVTTGTGPGCDAEGFCGDTESGCVGCAVGAGGPCQNAYAGCVDTDACIAYADCVSSCMDPQCADKCAETYPEGAQLYSNLVVCVICDVCPISCDGANSGCP
ncbi:MAG: hypothetical protein IPK82_34680 [Polyangiaceae bacterium]|nr:hypothetical protein [Polyangiaceae bacterium]